MEIRNTLASLVTLLLAASPALANDLLVPLGASWKYLDNGSNQGSAWRAPGFNDGAWAAGPAQLGYGDGDEATVVSFGPSSSNKYVTTYFRHGFAAPGAAGYLALALRVQRDDGVVVFLNGTEILRDGMPAGGYGYQTLANLTVSGQAEDDLAEFAIDPTLLQTAGNVLAVEIHQVNVTSSDISFDLELVGETTPRVIRGPYLQLGTPSELTVRWRTNGPVDSQVRYGPDPDSLNQFVVVPGSRTEHTVRLPGLAPRTRYYYAVGTTAETLVGKDLEHTFVTAPPVGSPGPTRLWALGDCGTANDDARAVRDAYRQFANGEPPDLWLLLGDNAYTTGTDAQYQAAIFDTYPDELRKSVVWSTRGNHEQSAPVYYGIFDLPDAGQAGGLPSGTEAYYSFDWANVHFVCLDSTGSDRSVGGAMHTWLQADLASTTQDWILAYWHHPPYTKGSHDSDTEGTLVEMRARFLPVLEAGGVDLVLCGHSHSYERSHLIDGHYGLSTTLQSSMVVDGGDGRSGGDGAYAKADGPRRGTVYTVGGSSGRISNGTLDHPVMFYSAMTLGSLVIDVEGGRLDLRFLDSNGVVADSFTMLSAAYTGSYCVPKVSAAGCIPSMSLSGTASASSAVPFLVEADEIPAGRSGILFYGLEPANLPLQGGRLCVRQPIRRTALQDSGGVGTCGGRYSFDFNARIRSGLDPALTAGTTVYGQYWFRDPPAPSTTGLSDAAQFVIQP